MMLAMKYLLLCGISHVRSGVAFDGCTTSNGCSSPNWDVRWDMAGSGYVYCYGHCPLVWLANHTNLGTFGGVVGVDHCWTHQGMPCVNGRPREFELQDEFAANAKKTFPRVKLLQYRITSAVPADGLVHDKMVSDPDFFVRWHHAPNKNGSICQMPQAAPCGHPAPGDKCDWGIKAAAYDWTQKKVRDWFLEAIIAPTLKVADGAWIDGDGPGNGAWGCSGSISSKLPPPYPALQGSEIDTFKACENAVVAASQRYLIARGGFDYNCFDFIHGPKSGLPTEADSPETCASKLRDLDHKVFPKQSAVVLYGGRTSSDLSDYTDQNVTKAVGVFMLVRAEHWFFGWPATSSFDGDSPHSRANTTAAALLVDYGGPLGNMTEKKGVFKREYAKATVSIDCNTFSAHFEEKQGLAESVFHLI